MSKEIPQEEKFTKAELADFTVEELKELFTDYEIAVPKGNKSEILAEAYKHFCSEAPESDEDEPKTVNPDETTTDEPEGPQDEPPGPTIDINQLTNVEASGFKQVSKTDIRAMEELRGAFVSPKEAQHYFNQQRNEQAAKIRSAKPE